MIGVGMRVEDEGEVRVVRLHGGKVGVDLVQAGVDRQCSVADLVEDEVPEAALLGAKGLYDQASGGTGQHGHRALPFLVEFRIAARGRTPLTVDPGR